MPATARRVVLSEIKNGAKIGFEVEPPNVLLDNKRWTDPVAWNSCAVATINAIKFGIINTCPTSVKRRNKYFVVDSALLHEFKRVVLLLFQCMQYCPKKPDPDHPTIKQFREIFHASSTGSNRTDLRAFKKKICLFVRTVRISKPVGRCPLEIHPPTDVLRRVSSQIFKLSQLPDLWSLFKKIPGGFMWCLAST
jgi:hypothetical protein